MDTYELECLRVLREHVNDGGELTHLNSNFLLDAIDRLTAERDALKFALRQMIDWHSTGLTPKQQADVFENAVAALTSSDTDADGKGGA